MRSWKTTVAGLVAALGLLCRDESVGLPPTVRAVGLIVSVCAMGAFAVLAKDGDVSGPPPAAPS